MINKKYINLKSFCKNTKEDLTSLSIEELNNKIRLLVISKNKNIDKEILILTKELNNKLSIFINKINSSKNISATN
jgi:hypothetical protein